MAKRNLQLVQDSVNGLETSNGINVAQVTGAAVDNQLVRFDGTTGAIQNSGVVVDDSGNILLDNPTDTRLMLANGGTLIGGLQATTNEMRIFSLSTSPLSMYVSDLERMRIDSSGNVGIGITNPNNYKFNNDVELAVGTTKTSSAISVVSATTGKGFLAFADGTTGDTRYRGMIEYDHTADWMAFRTAGAERLKLDSSGNVGIGVTPSAWSSSSKAIQIGANGYIENNNGISFYGVNYYRSSSNVGLFSGTGYATRHYVSSADGSNAWQVSTASGTAGNPITWTTALTIPNTGGIQLPNTAIANATTLDWYEEATATLTATGMTTAPTGTGRFTRIGDTVTALIPAISGTSNATTFTLTGIPTNFRPSFYRYVLVRTQDNSGALVVSNAAVDSTGILTMYKDVGTTSFTASGTKSVQTIQIQYHI